MTAEKLIENVRYRPEKLFRGTLNNVVFIVDAACIWVSWESHDFHFRSFVQIVRSIETNWSHDLFKKAVKRKKHMKNYLHTQENYGRCFKFMGKSELNIFFPLQDLDKWINDLLVYGKIRVRFLTDHE